MRESAQVATLRTELGACLASHRERNGLTQSGLAERLYYDRTSISKIETGQQAAPQTFWHGADQLLGADGALVAKFDVLAAAKAADGQAGRQTEGRRSGQRADQLGDALAAVMLPVARASNRVLSTSASPDQIDAVIELEALSRALAEHSRRVLMGEPADWAAITARLSAATTACQRRIIIEPCVAGEAGRN